jgi:hypothetical protein
LVVLVALWSLFITIFWMVVGWRAMRANESLAAANRHLVEEIQHWRRSSVARLALKAANPSVSAAEEARVSELLMGRESNT